MSDNAVTPASTRISMLLDGNSFVEFGAKVKARSTDFNIGSEAKCGDGVITGYGLIDGNLVYVYSQDASVLGGSIGEMHAKKIIALYDMAMKMGAPIIGLIDCSGIRLKESCDSLNALGELYKKQALCSGVVPQITAVFGQCGGGLTLIPALSDFTFVESKAKVFVNSPNAIYGNNISKLDTSSAEFQAEKTGLADFIGSEEEILGRIRELISVLPANNEDVAYDDCEDDLNRVCENLGSAAGDTAILLANIADNGIVIEKGASYGIDILTSLIKLNGMTVGVVANRSEIVGEDGKITKIEAGISSCAADKASEFITFCDSFNIPVLTIANASGFRACECAEKTIAKNLATLVYAYATADVPKVTLVVGKLYGSAYSILNSKGLGADLVCAWPQAEIGMMDSKMAAKLLCEGQDADISAKAEEFSNLQNSLDAAAARGYVDVIIEPEDTRKYLIGAFEMLYTKKEDRPAKKHGAVL